MSTIHRHLGMWNPASSSSSSASWASSSSSASQRQCDRRCLPFFHGIHGIQCIHGKLYSKCKPCFMMFHASIVHFRDHANPQPSASGSLPALQAIPRHGFGSLLLASTQAGANNLQKLIFNYKRNNNIQ